MLLKNQFLNIRIDKQTLEQLRKIAAKESRNTSQQSLLFLKAAIAQYSTKILTDTTEKPNANV